MILIVGLPLGLWKDRARTTRADQALSPEAASFDGKLNRDTQAPALARPQNRHAPGPRKGLEVNRKPIASSSNRIQAPARASLERAVAAGLGWLDRHRTERSYWDAAKFMHHTEPQALTCECSDAGNSMGAKRLTGLCMLAFLSDGHVTRKARYKKTLYAAIKWIRSEQNYETGWFRGADIHGQSILTVALQEAYLSTDSTVIQRTAMRGLKGLASAPAGFRGWHWSPHTARNHPATASPWMALVARSAKVSSLTASPWLLEGARTWKDSVRQRRMKDETGFASAGALLASLAFEQAEEDSAFQEMADRLVERLPKWDPTNPSIDLEAWFLSTCALWQMGGPNWSIWRLAMAKAGIHSQRNRGHLAGSWDPIGLDRISGGRVHSTAMMVLCLQAALGKHQILDDL